MNAECERPLGAVRTASATIAWFFALAAHLEHADRRLEGARRRRRERGVRRDQDLGVAGAGRERRGQPQRVAQVADVGGGRDRGDRLLHAAEVGRAVGDDPGRPPGRDHADLAARRAAP